MKVLLANKYFFRKGGSEAVMFMEREFLKQVNVEIVDFSMQDGRNIHSPYADYFVANQNYDSGEEGRPASPAGKIRTALKLVHSQEAVRQIGKLIDSTRPDLVHCHNVYHQLTPSIIRAAKRRGVPVVLTLHDYKPICPVHTRLREGRPCSDCIDGRFSNVLKRRCAEGSLARSALLYAEALTQRLLGSYEQLDAVIAPSEFMRAAVTRSRFPRALVHVLPNGIDTASIPPSNEDEGYVLYLGRLSAEKGVETLLRAQEICRVPLRVAGTGPLEQALRRRYTSASFLGHLSGSALADAIRRAGAIAVPSEWYENCPISVLEAMAYGKPVIASEIGGIPELVVHGETGLLFPPGDKAALVEALSNLSGEPALRRRLGKAGRARAEQLFSIDRHNLGLLRLYRSLLPEDDKELQAEAALTSAAQD